MSITIEKMIKKYNIKIVNDNQLGCDNKIAANEEDLAFVKNNKQKIIDLICEENNKAEAAYKERQRKIKEIDGLEIIETAKADINAWYNEFDNSFDDVGGLGVRPKPEYNFTDLYKQYPRAAAYLKAKAYANANNYAKANAGEKAVDRIINGDDYSKAIEDMENEWNKYVEEHAFD